MRVGSLFAGIGGFDEGLRQAGMESSWQVEKEPFCLKVLKTRFPNAQRAADILTCRGLTSSVPASHARIGRSRERERDCLERAAASFTSLQESCTSFDPLGSCSRMFPDFSVVTTDETSRKSSGFSWSSAGMGFNGVCLTASFSESPRDAVVCSLSDVLESHAPQRFFLSQKAAEGILRRAEKGGRVLPTRLAEALSVLATGTTRTAKNSSPSHSALESLATPADGIRKTITTSQSPLPSPRCIVESEMATTQTTSPQRCANQTAIMGDPAHAGMDATTSYWDDSQTTDTLDCSMRAKGQMMPEKRRFACVLTPEESDRATTQPTPSRKTCETGARDREITSPACVGSEAEGRTITTANPTASLSVRRLTPTECEVLQGFPKGWTLPDTALLGTPSPFQSSSGLEIESSSVDR